jgi:predicted RNA polymerase sigma factor
MPAAAAVERAFREHLGRAVAALIRALGDWDLAEEAVQDAFVTALVAWPRDGEPRDPAAWIVAVARGRAIDRLRRDRRLRALAPDLAALAERDTALAAPSSPALDRCQYFDAARADLLRRAGENERAAAAYERALELTGGGAERAFLERRLRSVR